MLSAAMYLPSVEVAMQTAASASWITFHLPTSDEIILAAEMEDVDDTRKKDASLNSGVRFVAALA